jgi:hypothetical protein
LRRKNQLATNSPLFVLHSEAQKGDMDHKSMLLVATLGAGLLATATAGPLQRIGHTTLTPRHTLPDDKGMYAAVIDPTNGYAYFFGNYLFKLDIKGNLPVQIGPSIQTGQFLEGAIDPAAGYAYMPKSGASGGTIYRFSLGAGTNPVTAAGSLFLAEGLSPAMSVVIDTSDPNPANHFAYVACSGTPGKIVKIALSTFTEVSSTNLNAGENTFAWGQIDVANGYAYFATYEVYNTPTIPQILKIKLTPGANAPIRIGIASLGATPVPLWTSSIDTLHGYVYYGSDNGTTNVPETVFKVKLGGGDSLPVPVPFGGVTMRTNEVQLISQVIDPLNGYVYFGDDNTYPGRIYQFSLNGTNAPVELGYLQLQGGTNNSPPPNGVTSLNAADDGTNLPFGEVMFRSGVFDPVRGYAYFGQDCRPNQVVKVQLAQNQPQIAAAARQGGAFQFTFASNPGATFTALASPDPTLVSSNWTVLGAVTEISAGQYQFTDAQAANFPRRFYRVSAP